MNQENHDLNIIIPLYFNTLASFYLWLEYRLVGPARPGPRPAVAVICACPAISHMTVIGTEDEDNNHPRADSTSATRTPRLCLNRPGPTSLCLNSEIYGIVPWCMLRLLEPFGIDVGLPVPDSCRDPLAALFLQGVPEPKEGQVVIQK